ncbi:carbohydrate ABC transporter permease [Paenibacillus sp. JDR-2]|uniref:carbohydrate ABC transporter permease n=1 Tax=Paenibacillus sp. (strain JDR-2) TaxID=324057 RepID=UPI000166497E|nr:sugar ABC transporter permease [Paenibacillus sp. JDR-2]ACT04142.1 binding-protein-dependent transport systems inner membrane component [Paenibacillus sp. JDR-2]
MNNAAVNSGAAQLEQVKKIRSKRWETPITGYLFLSPWLIGFLLLTLGPMIMSLYYSFTDYSLLEAPNWVGFDNYKQIFTNDDVFPKSLKITITFVLFTVPLRLLFALCIAMLLNRKMKGMSFYRTMVYFPSLIGTSIAVSILWKNIFSRNGFINDFLAIFGIKGPAWIADPKYALGTLIILMVWQFGSSMIIFLAGLKQIPTDLYEASSVDGAGKFRQFISVTLPMLSPIILFNAVQTMINTFQMFTQAFVITNGGPVKSTYVYVMYLYEEAFTKFHMGYASALAWILLILIGLFAGVLFGTSKYWVFYENQGGKK